MTEGAPTQCDWHLQSIAEYGRMGWQKRSGYNRRTLVEASLSRLNRVIGTISCSRTDRRRRTEVAITDCAPARMIELECPKSVDIA